jgi:4-methylaminobutanoate oxidase (formaldehyde-forming)
MLLGKDASRVLSLLAANDVNQPVGRLVYTQMCNDRGGVECDVTVSRLAGDAFYILSGTAYGTHDADWIRRHVPPDADARLVDVTGGITVLSVMGPRSRDVLSEIVDADLSSAAFPFGTFQERTIAGAPVRMLRVTFVGELGWELHVPAENAWMVYERVLAVGAEHGIANAGYRAIDSLRLEKGYKNWGSDLTPNDTPLEAGHGWAVKLKTPVDFIGRGALEEQKRGPLKKRFATFTVDDASVVLLGRETIVRDGVRVGYLTSGGYGYTIEKGIGLGYVRQPPGAAVDFLTSGSYELEVAGALVPASVHTKPLYDPSGHRIKV